MFVMAAELFGVSCAAGGRLKGGAQRQGATA